MTITKFRVGMAALFVLGIAALFAIVGKAQGPSLPPGEYDLEEGEYIFNVPPLAGTPLPTDTATASPPTDTPVPPTDTPVPSGHNDTIWHPVSADISHTHNDDPASVNHIFGPVEPYTSGQSISYPWETPNENLNKHEGYKWFVFDWGNCRMTTSQLASGNLCVVAGRIQHHVIGGPVGAQTRVHSFWAELQLCTQDMSQCEIFRQGGHVPYGCLRAIGAKPRTHISLPSDDGFCDTQEQVDGSSYREHLQPQQVPTNKDHVYANWSTLNDQQMGIQFAFSTADDWQGIDVNDPLTLNFICPDFQCKYNHTTEAFYRIIVEDSFLQQFDDGTGIANFNGFTDRFGENFFNSCTLGPDCAPLIIENVPIQTATFRFLKEDFGGRTFHDEAELNDFDLSPPGEFWIEYPN